MDAVSTAKLDISIGQIPLSLQIPDPELLEKAAERYSKFLRGDAQALPIVLQRSDVSRNAEICGATQNTDAPKIVYDWNSSSMQFHGTAAEFRGVRQEYDLDSLIRILLSVMLVQRGGFLLHAATVVRDRRAYVFTGKSGAGKSTVASLSPAGSVLTDEISLLRRSEESWRAYGTPFWGEFRAEGANVSYPIAGIYLLVQAMEDRVARISASEALRAMLANVLFFSRERNITDGLLHLLSDICKDVPFYRLYFRKQASFWEAIEA